MDNTYDELLTQLPSGEAYLKEWGKFKKFNRLTSGTPQEHHYVAYLKSLRDKGMKGTTLFCTYSKLNKCTQINYAFSLKVFPRIAQLLKGYARNEDIRQASVMTTAQVEAFLENDTLNTPYWVVRKCYVAMAFTSGARCSELCDMKISDLEEREDGYFGTYKHGKVRAPEKRFGHWMIPRGTLFFQVIKDYLHLRARKDNTRFFLQATGSMLRNGPMGVNPIYRIPSDVATAMGFQGRFTGHSMRRSSATCAAESGASALQMQNHFGWSTPTMPGRYFDASVRSQTTMASFLSGAGGTQPSGAAHAGGTQQVDINVNVRNSTE